MGLYRSLGGNIRVKLTGADMAGSMRGINELGIPIRKIEPVDELSIEFSIDRRSYTMLRSYAKKRGDRLENLETEGVFWSIPRLMKRPVMIMGMLLLLLCGIYLPGRILFVSVEGNAILPDNSILEAAENCGIVFGASRRNVRSEEIKNALVSELPELQWVGVNTYGCRAVITVRERSRSDESMKKSPLRNVVANRDAVVSSVTVTRGSGQCVPGQAVKKGQVLISGYVDSGIVVTATGAEGDVMGITSRDLEILMPLCCSRRTSVSDESVKYSVLIGKKRINFYKGSGISGASCVKMYSEYVLTLPGGFELPMKLIKVRIGDSELENGIGASEDASQLSRFAEKYLKEQMVAGVIHSATERVEVAGDVIRLSGRYACTELIGRSQNEMIGEYHGKSDGTDRERGSGG